MSYPANKVARIKAACEEHGWKFDEFYNEDDDLTDVDCDRHPEHIRMQWEGQRMVSPPVYTCAGSEMVLHNAKQALARIGGEVDVEKLNRRGGPLVRGKITITAESTDEEILNTLCGRRVIWTSDHFEEPLSARVLATNKDSKHYAVKRNGKIRIDFLTEHGFRSVYLDRIVGIR